MISKPLTLYMLGNGFDLAHGLPTTYRDFFYFVEAIKHLTPRPDDPSEISIFKQYLTPSTLEYLTGVFRSPEVPNYIETIQSALCLNQESAENLWHNFFRKKLQEKSKLDTWIDFEKEIENAVNLFDEILFSKDFASFTIKTIYKHMGIPHFDHAKRDFKEKKLIEYEELFFNGLIPPTGCSPVLLSYRKECILFLFHELQRYIFCLELYLRFYVIDYCSNSHQINPFLKNIFTKDSPNFILSFNYTEIYKHYIKPLDYIGSQHIHGRVGTTERLNVAIKDRDYLHSRLVLGFHNHEKFESSEEIQFLWFEKFFQRMLCQTGTEFFSWMNNKAPKGTKQLHTIIYGHSLDKTDGDFIRLIFDRSAKITVYYYQESDLPQLISNLISIFDRNQTNYYYTTGILEFRPIPLST